MNSRSRSSVVCLGDSKQAAIYFDRVIIVDPAEQLGVHGLPGEMGAGACRLIYDDPVSERDLLNYNYQFQEYRKSLELPGMSFSRAEPGQPFVSNTRKALIDGYIDDKNLDNGTSVRQALREFARRMGADTCSVLLPPDYSGCEQAGPDDLSLTLANIPLIDTRNTSWEQIFELRADRDAMRKLRTMKSVLGDEYQGKEKQFIEDDLAMRLEQYENECRDHGLETCMSVLSVILDAKHLQTAIVGGVAATLLGSPIAGITTAASLELGQITLEVARRKHDFNKFRRDHELGYIIESRERLSPRTLPR